MAHQRRGQRPVERESPRLDARVVTNGDDRVWFDGKDQTVANRRFDLRGHRRDPQQGAVTNVVRRELAVPKREISAIVLEDRCGTQVREREVPDLGGWKQTERIVV